MDFVEVFGEVIMREDKFSIADNIRKLIQARVYGITKIETDYMADEYILYIYNRKEDFKWCRIITGFVNDIYYATGNDIIFEDKIYYKIIDEILQEYRYDILGRYLV